MLMVGFQFAVWLLAATPVCFGETRPATSSLAGQVGGVINDTQCGFKLFKANAGPNRTMH